jgi:hypothetical protein
MAATIMAHKRGGLVWYDAIYQPQK